MKKIAILSLVAATILTLSCCGGKTESSPSYAESSNILSSIAASSEVQSSAPETQRVTISIKTKDKEILDNYSYEIVGDKTVFEVLKAVCKDNSIELKYSGALGIYYIKSIDGLAEFEQGAGSGWVYKVNGKKPSISAGKYKLENGDAIEWSYSLNYGND